MTIRAGQEWGVSVPRPADLRVCASDAEFVARASAGDGPLAVSAGDLHRSVGAASIRDHMQRVEVDALAVRLDDDRHHRAVAHVVLRNRWASGRVVLVMNADHLGEWYVAPRAHPNDGRFDVCELDPSMSIRQRWAARRRASSGTHIPHPSIATSARSQQRWEFDSRVGVWVDGVRVGSASVVDIEVVPNAFTLHI